MSSQSSTLQTRTYGQIGARVCFCGQMATLTTSWSDRNPGRKYYQCPILNGRERGCAYFDWAEPPKECSLPPTSPVRKNIGSNDNRTQTTDLLQHMCRIENEIGRLQVMAVECMKKDELHLKLLVGTWILLALFIVVVVMRL